MTQDARAFNWDSIPIRVGSSANPAAGVASIMVYTVPVGKRAKLIALSCDSYIRDATGANVYFNPSYVTGSAVFIASSTTTNAATASTTWAPTLAIGAGWASAGTTIIGQLPDIELAAGTVVTVWFTNKQATDDSAIWTYVVKEVPT